MKLRIAGKLIAAMGVTLTLALTAGFWVVLSREDKQARADFGQELATITGYARSVREFLSENLPAVGIDSTYHDLNAVPVIAAWRTAQRYTQQKAYTFRTPALTPRSSRNQPNRFERRALMAFQNHPELQEYAEEVFWEGQWVFQYAVPMRLTEDCLPCHGTPAGKPDPFGYPREGLAVGDLRGAFSVAAPLAPLMARQQSNRTALFWVGLSVVVVTGAAIFVAVRIVTNPLDTFLGAIRRMGEGKIGERVQVHSGDEVGELAREFNRMADRLEASYATLEERVQENEGKMREDAGR